MSVASGEPGSLTGSAATVLSRERLAGTPLEAAEALLGMFLVREEGHGRRVARITEVEAYGGPEDLASHARFGPTGRSQPMFGEAGHAYVYLVYGMHHCLNVTSGTAGTAGAVLVRAVFPLEGIEALREARIAAAPVRQAERIRRLPAERLCAGPGLVAAAFGIGRRLNGADLLARGGSLRIEPSGPGPRGDHERAGMRIVTGPRVGIGYAAEPWRSIPWRLRLADPTGPR